MGEMINPAILANNQDARYAAHNDGRGLDMATPDEEASVGEVKVDGIASVEDRRAQSDQLEHTEIPRLQARIDKAMSDLQRGKDASKKLNAPPALVEQLTNEAQAALDKLDDEMIALLRKKEALDQSLKV